MGRSSRDIDVEELRRAFSYDPETGVLRRLVFNTLGVPAREFPGIAGRGYLSFGFNGQSYLVHRLIWLIVYGEWPPKGMNVDHRNRNKLDNRLINLRLATPKQSSANVSKKKTSSSLPKGVQYRNNLYRARMTVSGKEVHLGYFKTANEAHAAYMSAARETHGEFATDGLR